MPVTLPSPRTWTLRFKNDRTTILLHVDPLQRLSAARSELLSAVRESHPDGSLGGVAIPQNPDDILLARPVDARDLSLGWEPLDVAGDVYEDGQVGSGKGKAIAALTPNVKSIKSAGSTSLQSVGLRDGGVVAFKFREMSRDEDEEDFEMVGDEGLTTRAPETWNVVVPTFEETYAEDDVEAPLADT